MLRQPKCDCNRWGWWRGMIVAFMAVLSGCGTTKMRTATDQLLMSDAIDRTIASIDFRPLTGQKVYFDTQYIQTIKGLGFVNANYIVSSLRQQIISAGCLLQETPDAADIMIEARVGTLGADGYAVSYGIPASSSLSTAAVLIPESPPIPTIPEISIGRRESTKASAKVAVFAYDRETRQPVWQSGIAQSDTDARDTWVLGIGPFESGTVRERTRIAGKSVPFFGGSKSDSVVAKSKRRAVDYSAPALFKDGIPIPEGESLPDDPATIANKSTDSANSKVEQASYEQAKDEDASEP